MIISTVIMVACFILIIFELISTVTVFKSCRSVRCSVDSSEKICKRVDGCLVREYWKTEITFELDGTKRSADLETSTFCQKGQILNCYFYPKKNLVFRKRDIRNVMRAHSVPAFSVGILFLLLNLLFRMTSLGGIILHHLAEAAAILLLIPFISFGIGFIIYAVNAFRHTRAKRVTSVSAEIVDVVRKSKRNRETERFTYYPIYRYNLRGTEHTVISRAGRENMPKKGTIETVLADTKKGGLVEYKDMGASFLLGACFIVIAGLLLYTVFF